LPSDLLGWLLVNSVSSPCWLERIHGANGETPDTPYVTGKGIGHTRRRNGLRRIVGEHAIAAIFHPPDERRVGKMENQRRGVPARRDRPAPPQETAHRPSKVQRGVQAAPPREHLRVPVSIYS